MDACKQLDSFREQVVVDTWRKLDVFCAQVAATPAIEIFPESFSSLGEARATLGDQAPARLVVQDWELFLSRRRQGSGVFWHLSAKFYPQDRTPMRNDWEVLRGIAAHVGALHAPPLVARGPRVMAHWTWSAL